MTTLRFPTIWDLPSFNHRVANEANIDPAPFTERFLTIWDSPRPRRAKASAGKRASRKLPKFYL